VSGNPPTIGPPDAPAPDAPAPDVRAPGTRGQKPALLPKDHRVERLIRLYAGLSGFGISLAFMVRARLGVGPWDVLHQGIARQLGVQIGWVVIAMSAVVLLAWIPLRQRPGLGTISNLILVGLVTNGMLDVLPTPTSLWVRIVLLTSGIALNAVATALYIGAGLGPGPRDGIMTGLAARGHSIRVVRTCLEVSVVVVGYPLGGTVGPGTLAYALLIGPLVHVLLPRLTIHEDQRKAITNERKAVVNE
jgi:uncharacterized membrane protein YczE